MAIWMGAVGTLFVVICILLIVVVLLQKGRGGGLGAALGGAASSAFGTRTGDVFTWITIVLTGLFLLLAVVANFAYRPAASVVAAPIFQPGPTRRGVSVVTAEMTRVKVTCPTRGTEIHYTLDGAEPTKKSPSVDPRDNSVRVPAGRTLKARAFRQHWEDSAITAVRYLKQVDAPVIQPKEGKIEAPIDVTVTCPTRGAEIRYTLDGSDPTDASPLYVEAVRVQPGTTVRARAFLAGHVPSDAAAARFERKEPTTAASRPES
jgi:protein translocase SecG subunit